MPLSYGTAVSCYCTIHAWIPNNVLSLLCFFNNICFWYFVGASGVRCVCAVLCRYWRRVRTYKLLERCRTLHVVSLYDKGAGCRRINPPDPPPPFANRRKNKHISTSSNTSTKRAVNHDIGGWKSEKHTRRTINRQKRYRGQN